MSSAWDYEANACSNDGKFSAKFEGCEVAMGAPTIGELRLFINSEHCLNLKNEFSNHAKTSSMDKNLVKDDIAHQILLSERATACFLFSKDSKFLAFSEWTADKMQIVKVVRLADMSIKTTVGKPKRVVEFLSFDDGLLEILDSPIFMPKNYTLDIRTLFDDKI